MGNKHRLWTGDFVLLLGINLLAYICCQALNNGTPIYVNRYGGASGFAGGLILEFSLCAALARIVAGRLIDNGSRKRIMVTGALVMLVGTAPCAVVGGIAPQLVFRALQGIGFGCMHTAASTAAADVLPQERLGEGIGYFGLGQSLGMAIGPTFAVVLTSMVFAESLFVGVAAVAATVTVLVLSCTYETHPERLPETSAYRIRHLGNAGDAGAEHGAGSDQPSSPDGDGAAERPAAKADFGGTRTPAAQADASPASSSPATPAAKPSLLESLFVKSALCGAIPMAIACLGYSIIVNFATFYGTQAGYANPGMYFVMSAITMTAVRLGGGRLIDRIAPIRLFAAPLACGVIALVMMANAPAEPVFWAAGLFFGLSMGLAFPLLNSVCVKNTVPERWGAASGLFGLMNDVGIGVGALVWGAVADATGFVLVMYGGCIMFAAAYVAALALFPRA